MVMQETTTSTRTQHHHALTSGSAGATSKMTSNSSTPTTQPPPPPPARHNAPPPPAAASSSSYSFSSSSSSSAALREFDVLLNKTVKDVKLSETKVKKLSEAAVRLLKHESRLVSSLVSLHTSLPARSPQKIQSLYTLDSISRPIARLYEKSTSPDQAAARMYSGSYLERVQNNLVNVWGEDMLGDGWRDGKGWNEGKEKLRKIIGIWNKYNCFSPEIRNELQRLIDESDRLAKGATSGTISSVAASHDHHQGQASASIGRENDVGRGLSVGVTENGMSIGVRGASTGAGVGAGAAGTGFSAEQQIPSPPVDPTNFNSILSILAAAGKNTASPNPSTSTPTPPGPSPAFPTFNFDPKQLSSLAQMTAQVSSQQAFPAPSNTQNHHPNQYPPSYPPPGFPGMPPPTLRPSGSAFQGVPPPPAPSYNQAMAKRDEIAKRLGGLGGRPGNLPEKPDLPLPSTTRPQETFNRPHPYGQGRDSQQESYDTRQGPPGRYQDRQGGQRPPHQSRDNGYPRRSKSPLRSTGRTPLPSQGAERSDRDEFGRSTRPQRRSASPPNRKQRERSDSIEVEMDIEGSDDDQPNASSAPATVPAHAQPQAQSFGQTLDAFDFSTFNPGDHNCWDQLGRAWRNTHGSEPSQEQMMMLVMPNMGMMAAAMMNPGPMVGGGDGMGAPAADNDAGMMGGMNMGMAPPPQNHLNGMSQQETTNKWGGHAAQ